jgi:pimeloyl-ACP methyl ester carboxylesterase
MSHVRSHDGTKIAYETIGRGPPVVLVDGALSSRQLWGGLPLAAALSRDCTVYAYDRRGRGESTDAKAYAVEREIEDIEALIDEAGGTVYLYGSSSGAVLALKAAAALGTARVAKLALYEPPFNAGDEQARQDFARFTGRVVELLEAGRRDDALVFFMADTMSAVMIEELRQSPRWPLMKAMAPTLTYDIAVMCDGSLPVDAARNATMPALVIDGEESRAFMHDAADALARSMPHAERVTLEGQRHDVTPEALALVLVAFFRV